MFGQLQVAHPIPVAGTPSPLGTAAMAATPSIHGCRPILLCLLSQSRHFGAPDLWLLPPYLGCLDLATVAIWL